MIYSKPIDVIFKPSATLDIDVPEHKISNWHDIPGVFSDSEYNLLSVTEFGTKHKLNELTTTRLEIYAETLNGGDKFKRYYIRKSPDSNAIQFRYDIYDSEGINDLTTMTLQTWKVLTDFYEKLLKFIEIKHPAIELREDIKEELIIELLANILVKDIKILEDSNKKSLS